MKTFYYVEAREVDEMLSFRHISVQAADANDAYFYGGRLMEGLNREKNDWHSRGGFRNDYVFEAGS